MPCATFIYTLYRAGVIDTSSNGNNMNNQTLTHNQIATSTCAGIIDTSNGNNMNNQTLTHNQIATSTCQTTSYSPNVVSIMLEIKHSTRRKLHSLHIGIQIKIQMYLIRIHLNFFCLYFIPYEKLGLN
jgi:hypothetical protein